MSLVTLRSVFLLALALSLAACGGAGNSGQTSLPGLMPNGIKSASRSMHTFDAVQPTITYAHNIVENKGSLSVSNTVTTSQPTVGNLLIANVIDYTYSGGGAIVDPPGWTLLDSATTSSTLASKTYYRWVQPGDTGIWTFNFTLTCYNSVLVMELANVDPQVPIAAHQIKSVAGVNAFTTASLSSAQPNSFAVALFSTNGITSIASEASGWSDDFHRTGAMQNVLLHNTANGAVQSSLSWANVESGFATLIILTPALVALPSSPPAPISTPLAVAPYHIATWAFDGGYGADNIAASDVARLVSYAEGSSKSMRDCHSTSPASCAAIAYFDPDTMYYSTHCAMDDATINAAPEDAFVHYAASGNRIGNTNVNFCGGPTRTYFSNGNSTAWQQLMKSRINNQDGYDAYFMDDTAAKTQSFAAGGLGFCPEDGNLHDFCNTTAEYKTDADVVASRAALAKALTHKDGTPAKLVYNGGSIEMYNATPDNYMGTIRESPVVWNGVILSQYFGRTLDLMAQVNHTTGFLNVESTGAPNLQSRLVHSAVILLGYSEGHTVSWEKFENGPSLLSIYPEALLYPSQPLQSMNNGAVDLQVAPGVWRREFAGCFLAAQRFGQCAVLLNANSQSVSINPAWLSQTYGHSVTFSGGDVLSGGQTVLNAPLPTSVPGAAGMILTP